MVERDGGRGPADRSSDGYDALAGRDDLEGWESPWGDNPLQRYYSWPATWRLLPDVDGKRVLDAGCGVGDHVEPLLNAGGDVVGIDASESALDVARERFGDRTSFRRADLTDPLEFDDEAFDVVLSHLVLDHVEDWRPVFEEFARVLSPGGVLVFTTVHPMQYYLEYDEVENYYEVRPVTVTWDEPVTSYHRPMSRVLEPLAGARFRLERLAEPSPPDEYVRRAAERWDVTERPQLLCVRARADPG